MYREMARPRRKIHDRPPQPPRLEHDPRLAQTAEEVVDHIHDAHAIRAVAVHAEILGCGCQGVWRQGVEV